jgi:hypothetical protein
MGQFKFQNYGGQGFAQKREIPPEGLTVGQFFRQEMGTAASPGAYRIFHNNQVATDDESIRDGDTIFFMAAQKHEGA